MLTPLRIILLFVTLSICSIFCLNELNIDFFHKEVSKELTVSFAIQSTYPEFVEQKATSILENTFSQIRDLKDINSISSSSNGAVQLIFDDYSNLKQKKFEVLTLLRQVLNKLPKEIGTPIITEGSELTQDEDTPVMLFSINSSNETKEITETARFAFKKALADINEIGKIDISRERTNHIAVVYDRDKLNIAKISTETIIKQIKNVSDEKYYGYTETSDGNLLVVKEKLQSKDIKGLLKLQISTNPYRELGDVAKVYEEETIADRYFRINGKNSILVSIYLKKGANMLHSANLITGKISEVQRALDTNDELQLEFDNTSFIRSELAKNYMRVCLAFIALLIFIIFTYKNLKLFFIICCSVIVNFSIIVIIACLTKLSIHIYTLAGVAVSFGVIVDQGIIILDYYTQFRNKKVILALITTTIILIGTLLAGMFLPAREQDLIRDFSIIIGISICVSLFTHYYFTVGLCKLLISDLVAKRRFCLKGSSSMKYHLKLKSIYSRIIEYGGKRKHLIFLTSLLLFGLPFFLLPERINTSPLYNNTIGSQLYQSKIRPILDPLTGGAWRLFTIYVYRDRNYRDPGETILNITANLPEGNTPEQLNKIFIELEKYLAYVAGISKYVTQVQSGQEGRMKIYFKKGYEYTLPTDLKDKLTSKVRELGGVEWNIWGIGKGFSNKVLDEVPNFKVKVTGYNFDELNMRVDQLAKVLSHNKRVTELNLDTKNSPEQRTGKELLLSIEENQLLDKGIQLQNVMSALQSASLPQQPQLKLKFKNQFIPLLIKSESSSNFSRWDILNRHTVIDKDKVVLINRFGTLIEHPTSGAIIRENRKYVRILSFNYMGAFESGYNFLSNELDTYRKDLPIGYSASLDEQYQDDRLNLSRIKFFLVLIVIVYFISAIFLESLWKPLYILLAIQFSFIGLFLVFYIFDYPFDQGGYASFILIGNLVTNSTLFLLYDLKLLSRRTPMAYNNHLLLNVFWNRNRTIYLTTLASVAGLIPFLMDGHNEVFWFSFATGAIGGLLFSLVVIPVTLPMILWNRIQ